MSLEKFSSNEVEKVLRMKGDSFEVIELPKFADISVAFDQREAFLDLYEAELKLDPNLTKRPDEWFDTSLRSYVEEAVEEPQDVFRFFDLQKRESRITEELFKREYPDEAFLFSPEEGSDIQTLLYTISSEVVARAFSSESADGVLHTETLLALRNDSVLKMLQTVYGVSKSAELLSVTGGPFEAKLGEMLVDPVILGRFKRLEDIGSDRQSTRVWMREICSLACNLTEEEADDYVFSASASLFSTEKLPSIIKAIDHFGHERLRAITDATGIKGLEGYTIDQLERMERFATNSELLADELTERDVNIIMINRSGDHNAVMSEVAVKVDDVSSSPRTLFFEVDSANDVYRHFSKLNKSGIKPSTFMLAAHGSKGRIVISNERDPEKSKDDVLAIDTRAYAEHLDATNHIDGRRRLSVEGMSGMARIVEEYMRESRGVDDAEEDVDRKKIVFISCGAAVETGRNATNEDEEEIIKDTESLVSQLGKDLQASGVTAKLDIYGAPGSIQVERTNTGLIYSGKPAGEIKLYERGNSSLSGRKILHAVKVSLENERITQQDTEGIVLRK